MSPKSSQSFETILPFLARDRFAVALDYPGYGESDRPPEYPQVRVEDYANSVWEVADSLTNSPIHVVGIHTGAMVAVETAHQRPDQTLGIVNISAPVFTEEEVAALANEYSPIPLDESGSRFRTMWERILFHRGPGMTLEMAANSLSENLKGGENYEHGHRASFNYAPTYKKRLGEIGNPLLVMNPNDDCFEQSKRADSLMKNGKRLDLPSWGHGLLHAHAEAAAQIMLEFLDSAEADA